MKLAERRNWIDSSGIRKVFDLAATLKDPCNLSIGIPDFDVPDDIKEVAIQAIRQGHNRYTQTAGIPPLREAILDRYRRNGLNFEDAIVTSGTSGGLFMLFLVTLNPGDEVLVPDPYFVMYKHLLKFLGVKPVFVDTYPDFRITREKLAAAMTEKTRMLLFNSPANPTGVVYSEEDAKMAADFARENDLILVADEIYEPFCFDGPLATPARYNPDTVVISGLSKSVGMTGWRVGWICGPKELVKAVTEIQQYTFVCAPSPAQHAAIPALSMDTGKINSDYRQRRDIMYNGLTELGFNVVKPGGAFYIFPEAPGGDGDLFVQRAIKHNLLTVPGSVFSERKSHFRISFASTEANLRRGLEIMGRVKAEMESNGHG